MARRKPFSSEPSPKPIILSRLIKISGKTQASIAADAQVSPAHLSRILKGKIVPTDETFMRIAAATGSSAEVTGLALMLGPEKLPLLQQSGFLLQLAAGLPAQLLEKLAPDDLIEADPRWARNIIEYVIAKTRETVERKRRSIAEFTLDLR